MPLSLLYAIQTSKSPWHQTALSPPVLTLCYSLLPFGTQLLLDFNGVSDFSPIGSQIFMRDSLMKME